jgi:RNA recognition motif-containing protein
MPDDVEAKRTIRELNGSTLGGRSMVVNEARPKPERAYPRRSNGGERRFRRS